MWSDPKMELSVESVHMTAAVSPAFKLGDDKLVWTCFPRSIDQVLNVEL